MSTFDPDLPSHETLAPIKIHGHQDFLDRFLAGIQSNTLHHAWLLTGPRGIGKSLVAQHVARFLLRQSPSSTIPRLETHDAVFDQTHQGTHPDFLFIEKGEHTVSGSKMFITIDAIRKMTQFIQQTSAQEGWKVVVIDSVDDMNEKAQNALLKSLEEPTPKTLFLLVSHASNGVMPTIRSRCHEVKLSPLSEEDMDQFLKEQPLPLLPEETNLLKTLARGRLGILQALLDQDGITLFSKLLKGMTEVLTLKTPPYPICLKLSETLVSKESNAQQLFYYLMTWYGHRIATALATGVFPPPLNEEEKGLFKLLSKTTLEKWLTVQEKLLESMGREQRLKVEPKQTILSCFTSMDQAL